MKLKAIVAVCVIGCSPGFAPAQTSTIDKLQAESAKKQRARLIEDCKRNRGTNCDNPDAVRQMERDNRPRTAEERQRDRNPQMRDFCMRNPKAPGC